MSNISPVLTASGFFLRAAPILETAAIPESAHAINSAHFESAESIASTTTSGFHATISPTFPESMYASKISARACGFISRTRSRMTRVFFSPSVPDSAHSWRLILDSSTTSKSASRNSPTPTRASASSANDPTAPTPHTATRARANASVESAP